MKQNILVSHMNSFEILDFIRNILFYNEENGYQMTRVLTTSSVNRYFVILKPKRPIGAVVKSWLCSEKTEKKYEERKVTFEAYDDHFVFENTNVDGRFNVWWILFMLARIDLEKWYDSNIMSFFQKQGVVYLSKWHFQEKGERIPFLKTETSKFPKLLTSKEKITIRGKAYGIYEKVVRDFETSKIIEIHERVAKDSNGKVYFLGI